VLCFPCISPLHPHRTKGFALIQTLTLDEPIVTAKLTPQGDRLAVGCDDGTVYIIGTEAGTLASTPLRTVLFRFKPMMTEIVGFGFSFTSFHCMYRHRDDDEYTHALQ
jgi:hypothetical protein